MIPNVHVGDFGRTGQALIRYSFILLCIGTGILFTGFDVGTSSLHVKPFDLIVALIGPIIVTMLMFTRGLPASGATLVLGLYLIIHAWSAFRLGNDNGLQRTVQAIEFFLFFLILHYLIEQIDWKALSKFFLVVLVLVTIYNVGWHISQGYMTGWKRLDEPKLAFLFLPTLLVAMTVGDQGKVGMKALLVAGFLALLLLISGERKAQLQLMALFVILLGYGYFNAALLVPFIASLVFASVVLINSDAYLAQQIYSLIGLVGSDNVSLAELQAGYVPTSLSNAQRVFASEVSKSLIAANPIFGIGTDAFLQYVRAAFPGSASWLIGSIHNEFLRVLVENGIVGFAAFSAIWLRCIGWFALNRLPRALAVVYLSFFSAFTMQFAFEGSGLEMFVMAVLVALMPNIFANELRQTRLAERNDPSQHEASTRLLAANSGGHVYG